MKKHNRTPYAKPGLRDVFKSPALMISTWFGTGLFPFLPGTVGSLATLPAAYLIHVSLGGIALACFALAAFLIGCWASRKHLKRYCERLDPQCIVIDEVAGQSALLCALYPTWQSYLTGFILFRLFDIFKPWPVSWVDRNTKGGFGVMADDLLAGVYPVLLLHAALLLSPPDPGTWLAQLMTFLAGGY